MRYLTLASYFYMVAPFLVLGVWFFLLLRDTVAGKEETYNLAGAFSVLIVGLGFILFAWNVMKIKWSNFRFKAINAIMLIVGFVLVSIYQGLVIFGIEHT
jgi:hypothetical protein